MNAFLLLGPTGVGKSPLGDCLEAQGLWGRRCHHFDFGEQLRRVAADPAGATWLDASEHAVVQDALRGAALLENENFAIARKIIETFAAAHDVGAGDVIVLNGLPRHVGQARDIEPALDVRMVISLECDDDVVLARIRRNTGGDRTDRVDDSEEEVLHKLALYRERTRPLLDHYRAKKIQVRAHHVTEDTQADEIRERIEASDPVREEG